MPKHFIRVALLQWGHLYFFILQFDDKIHWCQNIPSKGYFSRWHLFFNTIVWTCQFVASQFESETGLCQNISSKGHFSDWNLFFVAEMRTSKFSSFQFYGKTNWCLNIFSKGIWQMTLFHFFKEEISNFTLKFDSKIVSVQKIHQSGILVNDIHFSLL